ncbi:MAG: class I SAM-dependent methyltransferase [Rudaea sp.]|uniref:class I SAM-dependent methyltransferase n=1 Tax=Rudaea sp. 3F27F6 TaxID=2502208 RepID=UPI0010F4D32C|nr:class I SAM-dependent methyltransferase [Rudaea sp. 3F27F6]MBR0347718.1 class I SAM-dependent methyltransferase [Rudaea sp.]
MTNESAAQFEELADLYEDMSIWPFRRCIETPSVLETIGDVAGLDVVDFGCGAGTYARLLKRAGARRVVGFDLAEGMLHSARRRAAEEGLDVEFVSNLDAQLKGSFDLTLGVYVLPYAQSQADLDSMCSQMLAPLRPGGRLVTLPIHPAYEPEPTYYEPYGFRMTADRFEGAHEDGARIKLDLFFQQRYDASVYAQYWGRDAIESALRAGGADSIEWRQPRAHRVNGDPPPLAELDAYVRKPHAAIVVCRRA